MLSTTCCNVVLHPVSNVVLHPVNNCCQQPLFNNHCSTIIVQSLLTTINKLFSSAIVSSCSNNIVTTIVLCRNRTTIDRTKLINIENLQVLLNLDNNIVQALFNEQRCINLINFCACNGLISDLGKKNEIFCYSYKEDLPYASFPFTAIHLRFVFVHKFSLSVITTKGGMSELGACDMSELGFRDSTCLHSKKRTTCSGLVKTALNNIVKPTLFNVVNNIVQHR